MPNSASQNAETPRTGLKRAFEAIILIRGGRDEQKRSRRDAGSPAA